MPGLLLLLTDDTCRLVLCIFTVWFYCFYWSIWVTLIPECFHVLICFIETFKQQQHQQRTTAKTQPQWGGGQVIVGGEEEEEDIWPDRESLWSHWQRAALSRLPSVCLGGVTVKRDRTPDAAGRSAAPTWRLLLSGLGSGELLRHEALPRTVPARLLWDASSGWVDMSLHTAPPWQDLQSFH